ncbi:UEV-domain-containing protein [Mycena indigotica]|uniref:UEV-domain-containing protein n=1 Tax=Mycena indigotica TaxID=2126181 RepID=A0A8H6S8J0_9AGAR|nr:UEV-domain-containing protein [Mycena indigotica]KAF7294965.1 UEV-domain-containing protein [Mycena indigotica]
MDLTRRWLSENVAPYPAKDTVYAHIDAALTRYPSLRPKADIYTYDDGRTQLLLCLHGLLPITYRAASYNIPIAVWIPRTYPREPPLPYVVPTADMLVKAGPNLDVSGRSSIDYVQHWARKHEGCDLAALIDSLQTEFCRSPPVYAKPTTTTTTPVLPPKPITSPPILSGPPPIPPRPDSGPPQYRPAPPQYQPQFVPRQLPPVSPPPPIPQQYQTPPPPPPPAPNLLDEEPVVPIQPIQMTAPPPPRPPNPELVRLHSAIHSKLIAELSSLQQALSIDAERLRAHQADLLAGEPAIRDEMGRLEAVRDVCRTAAGRMRNTVETAERNVSELRAKSEPEVDELVCSTTIVHNQLINLVAEDNAIEDTIFHLSKALNSGRIDLDRFLRSCRLLAEEQFMKRALIDKIVSAFPMSPAY